MAMDPSTGLPANYTMPQSTTPANYMLPEAEQARRKMAMELMYGKGQTQQPEMKHWTQLLGNIGNSYAGNKMFNQANQQGRASDVHDTSTFEGGLWGQPKPPVLGVGGATPFQTSGPIPGQVGPMAPSPSGQPTGMTPTPPPQGMGGPLSMPPPQGAGGLPPMAGMQPRPPMQFPGAGGLPQPEQWPPAGFNPQG